MRRAACAALVAAALFARPAAAADDRLPPGRYAVTIKGMICEVCARAVAAEWSKLPEIEKAEVDRESGRATFTVRRGKTLKPAALLKALRRAEKTASLGATFETSEIRNIP